MNRVAAPGSTGDPPVPSNDSPDGTGKGDKGEPGLEYFAMPLLVAVGESPTATGESPVPPGFQTGSQEVRADSRPLLRFET